jgi:hypothetical protein
MPLLFTFCRAGMMSPSIKPYMCPIAAIVAQLRRNAVFECRYALR